MVVCYYDCLCTKTSSFPFTPMYSVYLSCYKNSFLICRKQPSVSAQAASSPITSNTVSEEQQMPKTTVYSANPKKPRGGI